MCYGLPYRDLHYRDYGTTFIPINMSIKSMLYINNATSARMIRDFVIIFTWKNCLPLTALTSITMYCSFLFTDAQVLAYDTNSSSNTAPAQKSAILRMKRVYYKLIYFISWTCKHLHTIDIGFISFVYVNKQTQIECGGETSTHSMGHPKWAWLKCNSYGK